MGPCETCFARRTRGRLPYSAAWRPVAVLGRLGGPRRTATPKVTRRSTSYAVSPGHRRRPGDTLISWGCHRCPEDTGSFRQYKNYKTTPRFSALYHTRSSQQAQPRGGLAKVPATLLCPLPGLSCECVCRARRAAHPATATTQSPRERLAVPLLLAAPVACSQSRYAHGK